MNRNIKLVASAAVVGTAMAFAISAPAFAWHPKGVIIKYVQNQTAGGQMADANNASSAISAKPGDTLKYTIIIENKGAANSRGYNDMYFTKLTDTLPAGVELVSDASKRTITEDLGVIKPGQKVTREYIVKVISTKDGDIIENKACFTGDSEVKDQPQKGCDPAVIKVSVPAPPTTPELPKTPEQPQQPAPQVLPVTGPANVLGAAGAVSVLGYAANLLRLKRRAQR
jgi:uncharacterized repeat protein (TIGR01451 family)